MSDATPFVPYQPSAPALDLDYFDLRIGRTGRVMETLSAQRNEAVAKVDELQKALIESDKHLAEARARVTELEELLDAIADEEDADESADDESDEHTDGFGG
jgi:septal ring factor EnvC (AmiA/AmiB activator)